MSPFQIVDISYFDKDFSIIFIHIFAFLEWTHPLSVLYKISAYSNLILTLCQEIFLYFYKISTRFP